LLDAMRYASLGAGKRFRPFLVVESASLFGVPREQALLAGVALECVHCYSLVHDDLPAMDNDDLRRGQPTAPKAFDVATGILAVEGDPALVGKQTGKDAEAGKATIVGLLGPEGARARLRTLVAEAETALAPFGESAAVLIAGARFVAERHA